jgi:Zn-dependent protease
MNMAPDILIAGILKFAIVLFSLSVHESAHAWMADRLGDNTGRMLGRITLNPWPHIDLIWTILLPLVLAVSGSPVLVGAAKPVPVISRNLRRIGRDMALVGIAGPVSNILLAIAVTVALGISMLIMGSSAFSGSMSLQKVLGGAPVSALEWVAMVGVINVALASFNLIPLPPLDGSWVLSALLPASLQPAFESFKRLGPVILGVLFLSTILGIPVVKSLFSFIFLPVFYIILAMVMILPLHLLSILLGG